MQNSPLSNVYLNGSVELLILAVLDSGPNYGYFITQAVLERSGGRFELKEGSLYPALHRMEREKLLASKWEQHEGRRRKYYYLTASGKKALAARKQEWNFFVEGVQGVLGAQLGLVM